MKFKQALKYYVVGVVLALASSACHDKSGQTVTTTTTTTTNTPPVLTVAEDSNGYAADVSKLEWVNVDVISIVNSAGATYNGALLRTTLGSCATVGIDTVSSPHQIVIRFGVDDCTCLDGRSRRGTIVVSFTGQFSDSGSQHTITYSNYFVNDIQVTGKKLVTDIGAGSSGQLHFLVTMNDSLVTPSDSVTTWTGTRVETIIAGNATPSRTDDVYTATGSATLTRANGHVFTYEITSPVQVAQGCSFVESGVATVTSPALTSGTRTLDFGPGTCDNLLKLTIDTAVYNITFE